MHGVRVAAPFAALLGLGLLAGCTGHGIVRNGDRVPEFTLTDLDGNAVGTESARGKLLVLGVLIMRADPVHSEDPFAEDSRHFTKNMTWLRSDFPDSSIIFLTIGRGTAADLRDLREWAHANWSFALVPDNAEKPFNRYFITDGIWVISPDGIRLLLDHHPAGGGSADCAHDLISDYVQGKPVEPRTC